MNGEHLAFERKVKKSFKGNDWMPAKPVLKLSLSNCFILFLTSFYKNV